MIFLTVGTYPLSFERLIKAIDVMVKNEIIAEEVFAQIGPCRYEPKHMKYTKILDKDTFDCYFKAASAIISHAGIGAIEMALGNNKPLLVMPRLREFSEVVNDHQVATAKKFSELGHVLSAYNEDDLREKIKQLRSFVPKKRDSQPDLVAARIAEFLKAIQD